MQSKSVLGSFGGFCLEPVFVNSEMFDVNEASFSSKQNYQIYLFVPCLHPALMLPAAVEHTWLINLPAASTVLPPPPFFDEERQVFHFHVF